jgi:hypothetical protein
MRRTTLNFWVDTVSATTGFALVATGAMLAFALPSTTVGSVGMMRKPL